MIAKSCYFMLPADLAHRTRFPNILICQRENLNGYKCAFSARFFDHFIIIILILFHILSVYFNFRNFCVRLSTSELPAAYWNAFQLLLIKIVPPCTQLQSPRINHLASLSLLQECVSTSVLVGHMYNLFLSYFITQDSFPFEL